MIDIKKEKPKCNGVPYLVRLTHHSIKKEFCEIGTFYGGAKPEWDFSWSYNENGENFAKKCKVTHWDYLPTHQNISL